MTKSVQSVVRSLQVLEFLNQHAGADTRQVVAALGLSRGTAYRLLETLRQKGYLRKEQGSPIYWLTEQVRALSDGYQAEWWIDAFARQIIIDLGERAKWPVKLLTLSGYEMLTRVTTDFQSPLTDGKIPAGFRVSLLWTAAGRAFLAFVPDSVRAELLRGCRDNPATQRRNQRPMRSVDTSGFSAILSRIQQRGYEIVDQPKTAYFSLAVPVIVKGAAVGSIAMFFFRASIKQATAVRDFKPMLDEAARAIADGFGER